MVTLAAVSLFGLWSAAPQSVTAPACRFVRYYQAFEKTDRGVSLWERVVYSLLLTKASASQADPKQCDGRAPTSS